MSLLPLFFFFFFFFFFGGGGGGGGEGGVGHSIIMDFVDLLSDLK